MSKKEKTAGSSHSATADKKVSKSIIAAPIDIVKLSSMKEETDEQSGYLY